MSIGSGINEGFPERRLRRGWMSCGDKHNICKVHYRFILHEGGCCVSAPEVARVGQETNGWDWWRVHIAYRRSITHLDERANSRKTHSLTKPMIVVSSIQIKI